LSTEPKIWYAAFGSNMHLARFACYIAGGRPAGGARRYPGCRDRRLPERSVPVALPGSLYFALESLVWSGGMAFYDPFGGGRTAARAYLVTPSQFSDIAAQEMRRLPRADLDLNEVLTRGRAQMGTGRYETLVHVGTLEGRPVLTFTAPWGRDDVEWRPPAPAYLRHLASGLAETHGWSGERIAEYLAGRPGAAGWWTAKAITALIGGGRNVDAALRPGA
jgi:hypothetical protein